VYLMRRNYQVFMNAIKMILNKQSIRKYFSNIMSLKIRWTFFALIITNRYNQDILKEIDIVIHWDKKILTSYFELKDATIIVYQIIKRKKL